ncbi:hypothetical protein ILUMI_23945, partial [Ignelater luminosus]
MGDHEREISALYKEVPTSDVSDESDSEDDIAQDIVSEHETDTEQEDLHDLFLDLIFMEKMELSGRSKILLPTCLEFLEMQETPCLGLDNTDIREERKKLDKLAAVRVAFEKFNEQCETKHYSVGEYVTLDEMLLEFRGRCTFRVYILNTPNKYGPFRLDNSAAAVSGRMTNHISESGRNVTMDRWFTSVESVSRLLQQLTNIKDRPLKASFFAYHTDNDNNF